MFGRQRRIEDKLDQLIKLVVGEGKNMSVLDDQIVALQADVAQETTVEASAITLINGIPALIANAVAAAQAAGATPAELASLTALGTAITNSSAGLAAAVTANTPTPAAPASHPGA